MFTDLALGAFTFRKEVYAQVEHDSTFTRTAWILVVVVSFLNQLGTHASRNLLNWIVGTFVGTIAIVIGFALGAFLITRIGKSYYSADVTYEEIVRTMGLAYIWNVVGVIGVITVFWVETGEIASAIASISLFLLTIAWFIAAKEALDLKWQQTIFTVVAATALIAMLQILVELPLRFLGFTAGALGELIFR